MNGSFVNLTEEEQENLLRAIETSLQVKKRHQFFLWTQGPLQAFIPHKTMISLLTRDGDEMQVMDRFNSCVVSEQTFKDVCHPVDGVVTQAMKLWRKAGDSPFLIAPGVQMPPVLYDQFRVLLEKVEFGCAAGHGSTPADGCGISSSFFFFAHMPDTITLRHAYFLDLLMPHIHMAFLRTLGQADRVAIGADGSMRHVDLSKLMSDREIEILGWVKEGKSNQEIGAALEISPLTVKNHVQRILRKLKVRNRAQAVSKATAMRLIVGYTGAKIDSINP